jgi:hypothetical protein
MNVDELLATDRKLTAEELEFLERETLKLVRELEGTMSELASRVAEQDPALAREIMGPARRMVQAVEHAVALPDGRTDTAALTRPHLLR